MKLKRLCTVVWRGLFASSIQEAMLYAACDSEEGIILTPMNGPEILLNDDEAKRLGEWLLHVTSQDLKSRRSVCSSVTASCPSADSTASMQSASHSPSKRETPKPRK